MLSPLSHLFDGITRARNWMYDQGVLRENRVGTFVVCVGNISVGGTGKTPVTNLLTETLARHGLKVAVLSRGYGGRYQSDVERVSGNQTDLYGDEPVWLAEQNPLVPVFVGRDRVRAAEKIINDIHPNVLLLDDAYQHRRLHRDLNILIIDATESPLNWRLLPDGRGREGLYAINRANAVILNKMNLATPENGQAWRKLIKQNQNTRVFEGHYELLGGAELADKKILSFSAIARPESFERMLREQVQADVVENLRWPDHYHYTDHDLDKIKNRCQSCGAECVVTTEKDAVKIGTRWKSQIPLVSARLGITLNPSIDELYEMVRTKII